MISQRGGVTIRQNKSVAGSGHNNFPPLSTVLRYFSALEHLIMKTDLTLTTLQTLAKEAPQTLQKLELYFGNQHQLTNHAEHIALLQRLLIEHQGIRYFKLQGSGGLVDRKHFESCRRWRLKMEILLKYTKHGLLLNRAVEHSL